MADKIRSVVHNQEDDQHDPDKHTEPVKLTNRAFNPFSEWSDWYGENGEAVVTFLTMKHHLYHEWEQQVKHLGYSMNHSTIDGRPTTEDESVTVYEHHNFENNFDGPGIYQDSTHYNENDKVDESYTIIIPEAFMTREICVAYIEKLNEQYNREFHLEHKDFAQRRIDHVTNRLEGKIELDLPDNLSREKLEEIVEHVYKEKV